MSNSQAMLRCVLVLALAYVVLLAASVRFGPLYSAAWLPLFQWQMEFVAPDYKVVTLRVAERQRQRVIEAVIETVRPVRVGRTIIPAGASVTASTVIGHQLLHPVLLFSLLLAWSERRRITLKARGLLLLLAVPVLGVVEMLDIPLVLLGSVQDLLLARLAPDQLRASVLVYWMNFLDSGGRQALTLAAAGLTWIAYRSIRLKKPVIGGVRHGVPLPE